MKCWRGLNHEQLVGHTHHKMVCPFYKYYNVQVKFHCLIYKDLGFSKVLDTAITLKGDQ